MVGRPGQLAILIVLALSGCKSTIGFHGSHDIPATYTLRTLHASFPDTIRVETLAAAATAALRVRGYAVESRDVTSESARIVAASPGDGRLDSLVINARVTSDGTAIAIRYDPLGDQAKSRVLLDAILHQLAM